LFVVALPLFSSPLTPLQSRCPSSRFIMSSLYLGNLPLDCERRDVEDLFSGFQGFEASLAAPFFILCPYSLCLCL
jgi:hypothetical protein